MAAIRFLIAAALVGGAAGAAALAARQAPLASPGSGDLVAARPAALRGRSLDSIRIGIRDTDWLELRRTGATWRVGSEAASLPADPVRVARLIAELEALAVDGPVARDPSSHAALGVGAGQAVHLIGRSADETVIDLRVGAGGFLRVADAAAVWKLADGALDDLFAGRDGWVDRTILALPVGSIRRIAIDRRGQHLELERRAGSWAIAAGRAGAALDPALADALAAQLERLEALDVTTAEASAVGLDRPIAEVQMTDESGRVRRLFLGPEMHGVHHAHLDGGPIWVAPSPLVDLIDRVPTDRRAGTSTENTRAR